MREVGKIRVRCFLGHIGSVDQQVASQQIDEPDYEEQYSA